MPKWVFQIILAMVLGVIGQLILKEGASKLNLSGGGGVGMMVWRMVSNPQIFLGLLFYGFSSIFWILVLKEKPLSLVYPMIGSSYILVVLFSWLVRHEMVSLTRWIGAVVITLGVVLISRS